MVTSEKSHKNLSDYKQFKKKRFEAIKKRYFSREKMRYSGNCIYDNAHTLFLYIQCAILVLILHYCKNHGRKIMVHVVDASIFEPIELC